MDSNAITQATCKTGCVFHGRGVESFDTKLTTAGLPSLLALVETQLRKRGRCRLLEIGCAEGRLLLDLLEEFGARVELHGTNYDKYPATFGADPLPRTNEHYRIMPAARLRILPKPRIHSADLQDMSAFPVRDFDFVVSQAVVPHIPDKLRALDHSAALLAPHGMFLHELDSGDLPPLDFLDTDLPRLTVATERGRVSAREYLQQCGVEVRTCKPRGIAGYLAVFHEQSGALRSSLPLDADATRELTSVATGYGPYRVWGVHSVYRSADVNVAPLTSRA